MKCFCSCITVHFSYVYSLIAAKTRFEAQRLLPVCSFTLTNNAYRLVGLWDAILRKEM